MPNRYVILHHTLADGEHWDLMLEHDGVLLTWRLPREPVDRASLPIPAQRIGDHRLFYLEHEGPVSGNRGSVRRVDSGTVRFRDISMGSCEFELAGGRLTGDFLLRGTGGEWAFEALP